MDENTLRQEYEQKAERYGRLGDEVLYIVKRELRASEIPIHDAVARVKPFESFVDKARRRQCEAPFEEIWDICGVRLICLFLSDLQGIGGIIESQFVVHEKDDKVYTKPEDAFGYLSVHYVASLPEWCSGPRYDDLKGLRFEIQVRTIAMHAWATISHYLDYKSPHAIPTHLRKDFHALSALFFLADSHFELFFTSSQEAKLSAERKAQRLGDLASEEINFDTLSAYLQRKYADRFVRSTEELSELVEEVRAAGYRSLQHVDAALQRAETAFAEYEHAHPPASDTDPRFNAIGVVRVSLSIADEDYLAVRGDNVSSKSREQYRQYRHLVS